MLGQFCLELFAILPLFSLIKKHKISGTVIFLLVFNYVFASGMYINDLSVDTLLPLFGIAVLFFIYREFYLNSVSENFKFPAKASLILFAVPLLTALLTIKNSSIFFIFLSELLLLKIAIKNSALKNAALISMLSPAVIYILWKKHCDYVFVNAASSMHAMTVQNYLWHFREKSFENIVGIFKAMMEFNFSRRVLWLLLALIAIVGILTYIYRREIFSKFKISTDCCIT